MSSLCELWFLIKKIELHESGIVDIIKYYMNTYTFATNKELKEAINLWCLYKNRAIKIYGDVSYWDVSKITNMSKLFYLHFFLK